MPTISLYLMEGEISMHDLWIKLKDVKLENGWITSKPSKYNKHELFIQYWWYEDIESEMKKILSEEEAEEIITFLRYNNKIKVLKRAYCFINLITRTLELYRGPDAKTLEIVSTLEKILGIKFTPMKISPEALKDIFLKHSTELKQAMFKNVDGLTYEILRGSSLENNEKFKQYLEKFRDCLRVISFRPKIKFLNGGGKYQVTINGDKGTIKISSNGLFKWRPRYEIRQIIFLVSAAFGSLAV